MSVQDSQGHLLEMHTNFVNESEWVGHYAAAAEAHDEPGSDMETSTREQALRLELVYQDSQERHYQLKTPYLLIVNGDQTAGLYDGFTQVATVQVTGYSQLRVTDSPYLATRNIPGGSCSIEIDMAASGKRQVIPCDSASFNYSNSTAAAMEANGRDLQSYCPLTQACGVAGRIICWEYRYEALLGHAWPADTAF